MNESVRTAHATLTALNVYPVKSCKGIALDRAMISATGIENDRRWMVVNEVGRFLTQRELPRLALIAPTVHAGRLRLAAPEMPDIEVTQDQEASVQVTLWGDPCAAFDSGADAAQWLSQFLGQAVRLVRFDPDSTRVSEQEWTGEIQALNEFSDGFPLLVIASESLEDLNGRMRTPLPMNRFRPNVVISGVQPYDEDRIEELVADDGVRLRLVKPCVRCKIPTTNQETGQALGMEPLLTLAKYRVNSQLRGMTFGQNAIMTSGIGSHLHVGQRLAIVWKRIV